jgi:hypothetical protein
MLHFRAFSLELCLVCWKSLPRPPGSLFPPSSMSRRVLDSRQKWSTAIPRTTRSSLRLWAPVAPSSIMTMTAGWTSSLLEGRCSKAIPLTPRIASTRTIAMEHSRMSPSRPACGTAAGAWVSASATTTMTATKTFSLLIMGKTSYIATMATALLQTSPKKPASSTRALTSAPAAPLWITTATATSTYTCPTMLRSIRSTALGHRLISPAAATKAWPSTAAPSA